jgi:hypothetical protein
MSPVWSHPVVFPNKSCGVAFSSLKLEKEGLTLIGGEASLSCEIRKRGADPN